MLDTSKLMPSSSYPKGTDVGKVRAKSQEMKILGLKSGNSPTVKRLGLKSRNSTSNTDGREVSKKPGLGGSIKNIKYTKKVAVKNVFKPNHNLKNSLERPKKCQKELKWERIEKKGRDIHLKSKFIVYISRSQ